MLAITTLGKGMIRVPGKFHWVFVGSNRYSVGIWSGICQFCLPHWTPIICECVMLTICNNSSLLDVFQDCFDRFRGNTYPKKTQTKVAMSWESKPRQFFSAGF